LTSNEVLKKLAGFAQLGVRWVGTTGNHGRGTCPFAPHESNNTFTANAETLMWDCKSCGAHGNYSDFLTRRAKHYAGLATTLVLEPLAEDRGLPVDALKRFHIGWIPTAKQYTVPIWAGDKVCGMQRYTLDADKKKRMRNVTGGKATGIIRTTQATLTRADTIWLVEGQWNAIAVEVAFRGDRSVGVIGLPGADTCGEIAALAAQDKHVVCCYDHDKAGIKGEAKAYKILDARTRSISSVHWPVASPDGYDPRDEYIKVGYKAKILKQNILGYVHQGQRTDIKTAPAVKAVDNDTPTDVRPLTREQVLAGFRKWMFLPDTDVLDVMFGTMYGNRITGDPIWLFIVGPPGCGKTTCLMSLFKSPTIVTVTTLTPQTLISGMNRIGMSDPSLLARLKDKILIVKDFTTILSMPAMAREDIFGVLRDAYDGSVSKPFGNGVVRNYSDCNFGILAGVTNKIEEMSSGHTVVGERFLKFYMRPTGGRVTTGESAIRNVIANVGHKTEMGQDLQRIGLGGLARAMPTKLPTLADWQIDRLVGLSQWIAAMRGAVSRDKYTRDVLHKPTAEVGTRLGAQLTKLAIGMAVFRGETTITRPVMDILAQVARDSCPDLGEEIVRRLYVHSNGLATTSEIAKWARLPGDTVVKLLQDYEMRGLVVKETSEVSGPVMWRLSNELFTLMRPLDLYTVEKRQARRVR